jgi:cytoskeletal protein RodZ
MPEVGATLRETRMRQRIDITELEVQTKIRAKYLRALENEEWDLLPGPTYVKSFLRTYGDALGLDGKLLVEEYKLRHEPMETGELHPIRPPSQRDRERSRRRERRGLPRGALVGALLVLILAALFALGQMADDGGDTATNVVTAPEETETQPREREPSATPTARRDVRLAVVPTAPVWVCLENARGRALIAGEEISPDTPRRTYRSRRFRVTLGNGSVGLRVNGKTLDVPEVAEPIGYEISRTGKRRRLPPDERPTCAPAA